MAEVLATEELLYEEKPLYVPPLQELKNSKSKKLDINANAGILVYFLS